MALAVVLTISIMVGAESAAPARSILDGVYSAAQVTRGRKGYDSLCARCHGETLGGGEDSPALVDQAFLEGWYGKSVGELVEYTWEEMPSDGPGDLSRKECTDITAYVLSVNDFPAGSRDLEPDLDVLNQILIIPKK
jgi:mono/diheme cytochrome c family protein